MKIKDQALYDKLIKARTQMLITLPFIASAVMMLRLVEDYSVKTAKTNGVVIKYNPNFVNTLKFNEVKWLLAHEALHCVLFHHTRMGLRIFELWNIAGDLVINLILEECKSQGLQRIEGVYYDTKYYNMATEEVYNHLYQLSESEKSDLIDQHFDVGEFDPCGSGSTSSEKDDSKSENKGTSTEKNEDTDTDSNGDESGKNETDDSTTNDFDENEADDSTTNDFDENEVGGTPASDDGEDESDESGNDVDKDIGKQNINGQEDKWKIFSTQSKLVVAKLGGTEAGMGSPYLNRLVQDIIEPKLNWRHILYAFMDQFSKEDYDWNRPSRRYIAQDLYLPSLYEEEISQVVVVWDTSGSIDQNMLNSFNAELNAIKVAYNMDITAIYVDDVITEKSVQFFSKYDTIECKPVGGGGTDFRPPFKYVEENAIVPSCLIYFTDGRCNRYPETVPYYPVLWVGTLKFDPPFGEFVLLTE